MKRRLTILTLFVFLVWCGTTHAATPKLVQYRSCTLGFDPGNATQMQTSYTCPLFNATTANNLVIVLVGYGAFTFTSDSMADDSTSDTFASQQTTTDSTNNTTLQLFSTLPAGGKRNFTATFTGGTADNAWMGVFEFDNVSSATAEFKAGNVGAASSTISCAALGGTLTTGDLIFQYMSETTQFTTASFTKGSQSNITWALIHADITLGTASQWGQYNATTSFTPAFSQGTSQAYVSVCAAFKTGTSGGDLSASHPIVRGIQSNNTLTGGGTSVPLQLCVTGNTIALQFSAVNTYKITGISDGTNTYTQIGSQVANAPQGAQAWYAKNVTPGCYAQTVTLTCSSCSGSNAATFMEWDIGGASTTAPLDTTIGTSGQASNTGCDSPSGGCSTGGSPISLTLTPSTTNEVILVHASTAADTETGVSNVTNAAFIASTWLNGGANTEINPTLADENDFWAGGYPASTASQTWNTTHDTRNSNGTGKWAILGFGIKAPAAACTPALMLTHAGGPC